MNTLDLKPELEVAKSAALRAGALIVKFRSDFGVVREKSSPTDLVTEVDLAAEGLIVDELSSAFPADGILTEERPEVAGSSGRRWIVDPLDGTANYVRGLWPSVVSIALEIDGELTVGVVFDPLHDELFAAALGNGATRNGERLWRGDDTQTVAGSFIGLSGTNRKGQVEPRTQVAQRLMLNADSLRDLGSSALQPCLVATGGLDAHIVMDVKLWDVAAGFVVAREAGCVVAGFSAAEPASEKRAIVALPTLLEPLRALVSAS